ncbi:MAG: ATP-binding protein, partial [Lachnospiraceae bacterium]|nr:ATP-binding protein [Lachnospiraceae bacterium]
DEYDTPMQEAWLAGSWDDTVQFFRLFFNATFKTNFSLHRAVITGITRISKESIFSDLNNLKVVTLTSDDYAVYFGFTEAEVFEALDTMGLGAYQQNVKEWYDGFCVGTHTDIYNPWSVASFLDNKGKLDSYWVNTSSNAFINTLMQQGSGGMKQVIEDLLEGKSFRVQLDEQIVFNQIDEDENAVWSLFMASGYLKATKVEPVLEDQTELPYYTLTLTNREVLAMLKRMVRGWFDKGSAKAYYNEFIHALLNDNVRKMNTFMNKVALCTFSSFDAGKRPSGTAEPERFYHGFVLGMVVNLADRYRVRSNRESGYGRYDVMLEPMDKKGKAFIFEFKVLDPDEDESTLEETVKNAHRQIEERKYETELVAAGIAPERIRKYGFAFEGKRCLIG